MSLQLFFIATSDCTLSRVDPLTLSHQTLMEIIVADFASPDTPQDGNGPIFTDANGDFHDVCAWEGISCDAEQNVTHIAWFNKTWLCGSFHFAMVPRTLQRLFLSKYDLSGDYPRLGGSVPTEALPATFTYFDIANNEFRGSFALEGLPRMLEICTVCKNAFFGSLNFSKLPPTLKELDISENAFSGSLALENLPSSLLLLEASSNEFVGTISLKKLPRDMKILQVASNQLTGGLEVKALPGTLEEISFAHNAFSGEVDLRRLPEDAQIVRLQGNALTGVVDVDFLPVGLLRLEVDKGAFRPRGFVPRCVRFV